jgi:hypothetical protein
VVTLIVRAGVGGSLSGALSGNGSSYTLAGRLQGDDAVGTLRDATGGVYFQARRDGDQLRMTLVEPGANGQPHVSRARELTLTRTTSGPAPAASTESSHAGATAEDRQLAHLLLSCAWCTFSYHGGSTYTGGSYGSTSGSRTVFSADGTPWGPQRLKVELNSNGYPIITSQGTE